MGQQFQVNWWEGKLLKQRKKYLKSEKIALQF